MINDKILIRSILQIIENGMDGFVFNENTFDERFGAYFFPSLGLRISKEMLDDIRENPDKWRGYIEQDNPIPKHGEKN
jgi:hypothetical protein